MYGIFDICTVVVVADLPANPVFHRGAPLKELILSGIHTSGPDSSEDEPNKPYFDTAYHRL